MNSHEPTSPNEIAETLTSLHISSDPELSSYQNLLASPDDPNRSAQSKPNYKDLIVNSPLLHWDVKAKLQNSEPAALTQYGILCYESPPSPAQPTKPLLLHTSTPWSAFLCGSQGSGKSHALSCILENCLLDDRAIGRNPNPLTGIVFHYDSSQTSGACEAAYLCSGVKTRVLVSKSNYSNLKRQYERVARAHGGDLSVAKLEIHPSHLNTERVKTLMAVGNEGEMPLYMHVIIKILREMAEQSEGVDTFDYNIFKKRLDDEGFMSRQAPALKMRIDLLESFVDAPKPRARKSTTNNDNNESSRNLLNGDPGVLTIIDLTDPVIDAETACVLFDICLSIFLSRTPEQIGRVVGLDEAHNYMSEDSAAAVQFTNRLLKSVREQRHQGTRVVIATQEPTINTALLDLCSITMVHRCTSPAWFAVLKQHIAGLHFTGGRSKSEDDADGKGEGDDDVFRRIVRLGVGESLLFCPLAAVEIDERGALQRMDDGFLKVRTRKRVTADGGVSRLA